MSTIVVVRKNGSAAIAADTLTTWEGSKDSAEYIVNHQKIFRSGDSYLAIAGPTSAKDARAAKGNDRRRSFGCVGRPVQARPMRFTSGGSVASSLERQRATHPGSALIYRTGAGIVSSSVRNRYGRLDSRQCAECGGMSFH